MPYIQIQITRGGVTRRQKEALISGATRLLQEVLNKDPQRTHVVLSEVDPENWGVGGRPVGAPPESTLTHT